MKNLTLMASMLLAAGSAFAAVPFQTTTVNDGKFAADTKWYTMQIGSAGLYLNVEAAEAPISLANAVTLSDSDYWCFTGNETDGFTIYNKAYGPGMALGAPSNPADSKYGSNGQTAYAEVMPTGVSGYTYLWKMTDSPNIEGSYYVYFADDSNAALNNRDGKLAFWTSGKDAGSSIRFAALSEVNYDVTDNVWTLQTDPTVTLSSNGATASYSNGVMSLGAGLWSFTMPDDKALDIARYTTADGTTVMLDGYPYEGNNPTIQGPVEIASMSLMLTPKASATPHGQALFRYDTSHPKYGIVYRIPAIGCIESGDHAGRLIAVNDYRYCGGDIGGGRIDLHIAISDDNGATWTRPDDMRGADGKPVARGTGAAGNVITNLDCGFGDPAIVTDRESGEILVVACCGRMNFFSSRRANPQPSARWWSKDGGKTWTEPDYGQWEQIYSLFDDNCKYGYIDGQFIGSGRMVQSKRVKVGDYYRIYAVMSGRHAESGNISNWVLYSDDFGRNWHILGDPMNPAVDSGADEPKCEELPDGSVMLAARGNGGNRNFNIFRYTDIAKAEGSWGQHINTNMGMGGINACNGEIMIVPVKDKASGAQHYLALQSFPYGGGRNNVSIAWKALVEPADYDEPSDFSVWGGRYQVSSMPSAYSTMCLQADNKVAFLFEEATFNGSNYTEMYYPISIETITGDKFEYCADPDFEVANRMAREMMQHRVESIKTSDTGYVGTIVSFEPDAALVAIEAFVSDPSIESIASFNSAIASDMASTMKVVEPEVGQYYRFMSAHDGAYNYPTDRFLSVNKSSKTITTLTKTNNTTTIFRLEKSEGSEHFLIYNPSANAYLPSTHTTIEKEMKAVEAASAAPYRFESDLTGHTSVVCMTPGNNNYPALHLKSANGTVVIWTISAGGSKWYMSLAEEPEDSAIEEIGAVVEGDCHLFDLQGRPVAVPSRGSLYITSDKRKIVY